MNTNQKNAGLLRIHRGVAGFHDRKKHTKLPGIYRDGDMVGWEILSDGKFWLVSPGK